MKRKIASALSMSLIAAYIIAGCGNGSDSKTDNKTKADTIIYGNIYTADDKETSVEALAIKEGKIVYSGDKSGAEAYVGDNTKVETIEKDKLVIPGMIDAHTHAATCWDTKLNSANIKEGATAEECVETIREFVEKNPDKEYYKASGWMNGAFENNCPTADLLDAIDTDKPIIATSSDGHSVWCNTAALKNANITADTVPPQGGTIEKDSNGNPNGCLRDNATVLPTRSLPAKTADDYIESVLKAQEEYLTLGYTGYNEAIINEKSDLHSAPLLEAYEKLDDEGKLSIYTQASYVTTNNDDYLKYVDEAIKYRDETKGGKFEVTDVKVMMDGVVEGSTAYLSKPYSDDKTNNGATSWESKEDLEKLTEIVVKANKAGLTVHFHAIGDKAINNAITCVENAYKELGDAVLDCRNVITHLQIVDDSTYKKMADLNMVANINPWCCKAENFYNETEVIKLGEERAENEYPVKSFLDNKVHCAFGTDYGSSFIYNSMECAYTFVTRMSRSGDEATALNQNERITPQQTISMMSAGSAWQMKKENEFGTLCEGQQANLAVLDKDIFTIKNTEIKDTKVLKTMDNGEWIYTK